MPRATNGPASRRRKKRVFKQTKGFFGARKNWNRIAQETLDRALVYAYRDRRNRKRSFRALWITRIGIAARQQGMSYNAFMHGLAKADVALNRKVLANIAVHDPAAFNALVETAKNA
jgi:large subunit ribosomal protein L20